MRTSLLLLIILALTVSGCSNHASGDASKPAPATVQHPRTEADLTTVTLSPEAIGRLGIQTVAATTQRVSTTRTLGGEVVVPGGRAVVVSAPVAGTLTAAGAPRAGTRVTRGETIRLVPLVPTERDQRIEAERAVAAAEAEALAGRQRLERLEQLLKDGAASRRAVEEARAQQEVAAAALEASRQRLKVVARNPIGPQGEIAISAPFASVLQTVSVAPGQTVAASAPLFEVAQMAMRCGFACRSTRETPTTSTRRNRLR